MYNSTATCYIHFNAKVHARGRLMVLKSVPSPGGGGLHAEGTKFFSGELYEEGHHMMPCDVLPHTTLQTARDLYYYASSRTS
jgi:hypothetical protein